MTAVRGCWQCKQAWLAEEFREQSSPEDVVSLDAVVKLQTICFEPHVAFKLRVPQATGIIRTGDCKQYANIILESAWNFQADVCGCGDADSEVR